MKWVPSSANLGKVPPGSPALQRCKLSYGTRTRTRTYSKHKLLLRGYHPANTHHTKLAFNQQKDDAGLAVDIMEDETAVVNKEGLLETRVEADVEEDP